MSASAQTQANLESFLKGYSIEVMPRTAEKVADFRETLPQGARVYIAHIEGTPIADMVKTAKRLSAEGFQAMPHFPARIIKDRATLESWISQYADAGVSQALLLAGGVKRPHGDFSDSMQLLDTGLFDKAGFKRLHVAGHPEGNPDIEREGGPESLHKALAWKQGFAERTSAEMAIVTQFCFEADPVIEWVDGLARAGVTLPVHIGVAGPAKLQTLIKFSIECGVGKSLGVLKRRARDISKLLLPFTPEGVLGALADHKAANPGFNIASVHFFPLGGIQRCADWATENGGQAPCPRNT